MQYCITETPLGNLLLAGEHGVLSDLYLPERCKAFRPPPDWHQDSSSFTRCLTQLDEYFSGQRFQFDLEISPQGTAFQTKVWQALCAIPYGETASYGDIAARIGQPKAARAIGAANSKNPIPVIIPCHRVIGKDGSLTGFTGGLSIKKMLLDLEAEHIVRAT